MNDKVVILAGGKGKRFRPFSFYLPKPLMPIGENPIIYYLINFFKKNKFKNFIISIGYQSELIKAYLGTGSKFGVKIKYFNEKKELGTAGPLSLIKNSINENDFFFLINGDIYTELNFRNMMKFAKIGNYDLVIGYIHYKQKSSFGELNIEKNIITKIIEKPHKFIDISAGIYVIKNSKNLNIIRKNIFYTMPQLINSYISKGLKVGAFRISGFWMGIENIDNIKEVSKRLLKFHK
jgi:NDP-sugar pyrophosphorylase family protein